MNYDFTSETIWLTMPDGIRLSASVTIPISKKNILEKFPVLLEYKPYRKDDAFYNYNQPSINYFTSRGFIVAKVDIRGTGSSEGVLIEREYTTQELDDCEHIIEQLAAHPHSNGRVGMYGLSWSAFNSLMMATLRRPSALRAIFAAHGSEDLYKNDIHYLDGIMHQDEYILSVDHENALPASPDYLFDEKWIKQRFTIRPWIDVYLENQLDGPFWTNHSIKYSYDNLTVPVYLLTGLYDSYNDFGINVYEHARKVSPKIKLVVGPFGHAYPEYTYRHPASSYDGRPEMVRWFNHWLKDDNVHDDDLLNEPDVTLFVRTSLTRGNYRYESEWPIPRQQTRRMFMIKEQKLVEEIPSSLKLDDTIDMLEYRPWVGFEAGQWWGNPVGDQRPFDEHCLIYEGEIVKEASEIIGFVNVSLQVSATARLAHWIVRLEDVDLDEKVWLVTGAALNGAQRQSPPADLEPDEIYTITFRLHFTTWTFFPGHRIRLAISNAMFPAFWPSPFSMNTTLHLNSYSTFIDLPIIPPVLVPVPPPPFTQQQVLSLDDVVSSHLSRSVGYQYEKFETDTNTIATYRDIHHELVSDCCFISALLSWNFTCSHSNPADVKWETHARQVYIFDMHDYTSIDDLPMKNSNDTNELLYPNLDLSTKRHFELDTVLILHSDLDYFYVYVKRQLIRPNNLPITFTFNGKHKRQFQ